MKLTNKPAAGRYPKFVNIGDTFSGEFVSLEFDVQGTFGPENNLTLRNSDGLMMIRCPSMLTRTLRQNLEHLKPGVRMTLKYVRNIPTNKGAPAKEIDVDVEDLATPAATPKAKTQQKIMPQPAQAASEEEDNIPF